MNAGKGHDLREPLIPQGYANVRESGKRQAPCPCRRKWRLLLTCVFGHSLGHRLWFSITSPARRPLTML